MTSAEASGLGISEAGKPKTVGGDKGCDWKVSGDFGVLVSLDGAAGIGDLNYSGKSPVSISVGKHTAVKVVDGAGKTPNNGDCNVFLDVPSKSSVGVFVSSGVGKTDVSCQRAEQIAKFIDSKLP